MINAFISQHFIESLQGPTTMTPTVSPSEAYKPESKPAAASGDANTLGTSAKAVKEGASDLLKDAKEAARTKFSEEKEGAASGLDNVASALRDVAKKPEKGTSNEMLSTLAVSAADGLEKLSSSIRDKDVSTLLRDVQTFAREQPVAFFGLTMAAGFMAARFLKASESPAASARHEAHHAPAGNTQPHNVPGR